MDLAKTLYTTFTKQEHSSTLTLWSSLHVTPSMVEPQHCMFTGDGTKM